MTNFKRIADMHQETDISVLAVTGDLTYLEKAGATQFKKADQMPKEIIGKGEFAGKTPLEIYAAFGFSFPEKPDTTDPDFMDAKLPAGWYKEISPTDPSGRTIDVFDANGTKRISVWYKAMPYDRRAAAYIVESDN